MWNCVALRRPTHVQYTSLSTCANVINRVVSMNASWDKAGAEEKGLKWRQSGIHENAQRLDQLTLGSESYTDSQRLIPVIQLCCRFFFILVVVSILVAVNSNEGHRDRVKHVNFRIDK